MILYYLILLRWDWKTVPTVLLAILTVSDRWRSRRRAGSLYRRHRYVLFAGRRYRGPRSIWRCWLCDRLLRRSTRLKTEMPFEIDVTNNLKAMDLTVAATNPLKFSTVLRAILDEIDRRRGITILQQYCNVLEKNTLCLT